jgi:hypothetical protein
LKLLDQYEDRLDARLAREAILEMKRTGAKPIPWSQVKREAGLR